MTWPIAAGIVSLPLWIDAPLWGVLGTAGAAIWAYRSWQVELKRRTPLPSLAGDMFSPLDVAISWRTFAGDFPTSRRGWTALLTDDDLWLQPVRSTRWLGGDRDYVRIPRLDIVGGTLASDTEVRVRFVDEGLVQEARITHVPRALEFATALGLLEERGSRIG